ncbi:hypothetical protein ACFVVU_23605 [Kitasatospora sp. NPDC057965]|uniref:hypothetical protein n=1 Tax=Kitasatospora sp. NPDC057965 TaxID=3346291 RepID=UPI0036DB4A5D
MTTHTDLLHIATQWLALRELLDARTPTTWPPTMGIRHTLTDEQDEQQHYEAALERAERTATAPGERPAPLRVSVLDTITELESELLALADEIAGAVQRPAFTTQVRGASPLDDVARSLALMGLKDQQDARRWRFNMVGRTGETAARWLAARIAGADGPFRPLSDQQRARIGLTATSVRRRLDQALGDRPAEDAQPTGRQCTCGADFEVTSSQDDFVISCPGCGLSWTGTALLNGLTGAA